MTWNNNFVLYTIAFYIIIDDENHKNIINILFISPYNIYTQ